MPKNFIDKVREVLEALTAILIPRDKGCEDIVDLAQTRAGGFMSDDIVFKSVEGVLNYIVKSEQPPPADDHEERPTSTTEIEPEIEQTIEEATNAQVEEDLDMLLKFIGGEYIDAEFLNGIRLHIQVDKDRMQEGTPEYEIAKLWLDIVERRSGGAITGKVVRNGKGGNGIIKITAMQGHRGPEIGESAIKITGGIDTIPRLFGLLNMAFAGSLIPNDVSTYSEGIADYVHLIKYIESQHFLITGESYLKDDLSKFKDGTIDEMVAVIDERLRMMLIDLPPAQKMKYDSHIARELLTAV